MRKITPRLLNIIGKPQSYELGVLYYNGQGVKRNYGEALKWFRKAAGQGNAAAYGWLGGMYYNGEGVKKNYGESAKWYRKAAEQGDAYAQNALGFLYYNGQGVKRNYGEALKWFRKAADQGNEASYGWLGILYYEGQGVKKDYSEAAKASLTLAGCMKTEPMSERMTLRLPNGTVRLLRRAIRRRKKSFNTWMSI